MCSLFKVDSVCRTFGGTQVCVGIAGFASTENLDSKGAIAAEADILYADRAFAVNADTEAFIGQDLIVLSGGPENTGAFEGYAIAL